MRKWGAAAVRLAARPGYVVWGILLAALLLRITFDIVENWRPIFDSSDYDRYARSLASGHGYPRSTISGSEDPTAMRMPRMTIAPKIPQNKTLCWYCAGTLK